MNTTDKKYCILGGMETGGKNTSLWIGAILIVGILSFFAGRMSVTTTPDPSTPKGVAMTIPSDTPQVMPTATPKIDLETSCPKSGPSQQKEYLRPYTLKEGDTLQAIAEKELGDSTRVNEITILNENQHGLSAGGILYLPPATIKSSSGHIVEVSGKIFKKDTGAWQLTYGGGEKGPGIWIPGYYFKDIPNVDTYHIGDCVTILMDNGVTVYSVKKQ